MSKVPLYKEVYQKIKHLIRTGEYDAGDLLPPEGELESIYGVSRTTVRKAVDMLVSEGYLEVKQGRGTSVLDYHSTQNLNGITSISETLRKRGYRVSTKSIYIDVVPATNKTSSRLDIAEGKPIFRVQRVIIADDIPIAILENYIDCKLAPKLDQRTADIKSLYQFFREEYGLNIDYTKDIISAKSADFSESQILDVRAGATLLTLRRITYQKGKPVSYDKSIIRADKYQFEIETFDQGAK